MPKRLEINAPGPDEPGFARRLRKAAHFIDVVNRIETDFGSVSVEDVDGMVSFIVDFVSVPADRSEAAELVWEASGNEFMTMLRAIGGQNGNADPLPSDDSPAAG